MSPYIWRKNFISLFSHQQQLIRGRLVFKTKEVHWLETPESVIIPVSIHSAFNEEIKGDLKMNALTSIIKSHVKGEITVLLSDKVHLHTLSLSHQNNVEKAFEKCVEDTDQLNQRYQPYFEGCKVAYWHVYISEDKNFPDSIQLLRDLYKNDATFRGLLYQDAEKSYTGERINTFLDKALFIKMTIEDLLEQCAAMLVLSKKGYRFLFYPGPAYASIDYVNSVILQEDKQIFWVNVFLSIEKRTIICQ